MKFYIATKGIVYNPQKYTSGEIRYFTSKEKAMAWLGFVGFKTPDAEMSWHKIENRLDEVDIARGNGG